MLQWTSISIDKLEALAILTDHLVRDGMWRSRYASRKFQHSTESLRHSGWLNEAVKDAEVMQQQHDFILSNELAYSMVYECIKLQDLHLGRRVQALILHSGLDAAALLANFLIRLFTACGSLVESNHIFCRVSEPDSFTWNAAINAHAKTGEADTVFDMHDKMQHAGIRPDKFTFLGVLKARGYIGSFGQGICIHEQIIQNGLQTDMFLVGSLVDMYTKCGSLEAARRIFDTLAERNLVLWNAIIGGYAQQGQGHYALDCFGHMQLDSILPDKITFLSVLKACSSLNAIEMGRCIHEQIIEFGLHLDIIIGSALVDIYAKCGSLEEARKAFNSLKHHDVVTWGAMIAGYAQHGEGLVALDCFENMQHEKIKPSKLTFLSMLKACSNADELEKGRWIHELIIGNELQSDIVLGSMLVDMYAKCGSLDETNRLFGRMPNRNVVTWGTVITACAQYGEGHNALKHFENMQDAGIKPSKVTYLGVLKACGAIGAVEQGRHLHAEIIETGLQSDIVVGSSLVDMYLKCGCLNAANRIFEELTSKDVVSWGVIIEGYSQQGEGYLALKCFETMQLSGIKPNRVIFLSILKACSILGDIEQGRHIHEHIIEAGFQFDVYVGSSIVDMYAKCGSLEEARAVFNKLANRNEVSWGAMIGGYAQHGDCPLALECFEDMECKGLRPDRAAFLNALKACSSISAIQHGKHIHKQIVNSGLESDTVLGSTLVDMYAKCGNLDAAREVFNRLPERDVIAWVAMLAGYAHIGEAVLAVECFEGMQHCGYRPNDIAFNGIFTACSRAGLVEEAIQYFRSMKDYDVKPDVFHITCMVDLLGRAGNVKEAKNILEATMHSDICLWMTLLSACKMQCNVEVGRQCFDTIVCLDPCYAPPYVLMSNIYASVHMEEDASRVEMMRRKRACTWRNPAKSWIEINNKVHEFTRERSHPRIDEVHAMLNQLNVQLKDESSFCPKICSFPTQMSNEGKQDTSCGHTEKLAIAFGLIETSSKTTVQVIKNKQMCTDCHEFTKLISNLVSRQIIVRCMYHVHNFKAGRCSCGH